MGPAINMKANTMKIENKAMEYLHGLRAMFIKAIIKTILEMAMAKCIGMMGVIIKGNGSMVFKMGKAKYMLKVRGAKRVDFRIM